MSSYVNFYLKNGKTGDITYLFGYSRSNAIYEIFYENFLNHCTNDGYCDKLTATDCECLIHDALIKINSARNIIARYKQSMRDLATWDNDVEEKMEYYSDWDHCIEQTKEYIEACKHAISFYSILKEMIEYNPDKIIILAGIDCYASREEEEANA